MNSTFYEFINIYDVKTVVKRQIDVKEKRGAWR
jgi:hypothetical protein